LRGLALNCNPPISISQEAGITVLRHHTWPFSYILIVSALYLCF
jgi:hypothetical protein